MSEFDLQSNPDAKFTEKELDYFRRRKRNMIGDLSTNDLVNNENRDASAYNLDKLALQKESFLVCQRNCAVDNVRFLSFSQKRFTGFRNFYEFEQKRVLVANENQLKILAYHPTDIAKGVRLTRCDDGRGVNGQWLPDPTEQGNIMFCCGGTYGNAPKEGVEPNTLHQSRRATSIAVSEAAIVETQEQVAI